MRADLDEHHAAVGGGDAIDQRRIEGAQVGHVPDRREGRLHERARSWPTIASAELRVPAHPQHEPGERGRRQQREHVLDAIEDRPCRRRVQPEQHLGQDGGPRVEADAGSPLTSTATSSSAGSQTFARLR